MTDLETCETIARIAHKGQRRWSGAPYITHPEAVVALLKHPNQKMVGWLHDVLEDCPEWTSYKLIAAGVSAWVVKHVETLTRRKYEGYYDYIMRIETDELGLVSIVKIADLTHNLSDLPPGNRRDKYLMAKHIMERKL